MENKENFHTASNISFTQNLTKFMITSGQLHNIRDPRRDPIISHVPFLPRPQYTNTSTDKIKGNSKLADKNLYKKTNLIKPAYAYKSKDSGLLAISETVPPFASNIANVPESVEKISNERNKKRQSDLHISRSIPHDKENVRPPRPALYPIAINGGGIGVYSNSHEFGSNNAKLYRRASKCNSNVNIHTLRSRRIPMNSYTSFERESELPSKHLFDGKESRESDVRVIDKLMLRNEENDDENSSDDPWKKWERMNTMMDNFDTKPPKKRKLPDSDYANDTLLNYDSDVGDQRWNTGRRSGLYNQDDFDFAIVLAPQPVYKYWAKHLDFVEEHFFTDDVKNPLERFENHHIKQKNSFHPYSNNEYDKRISDISVSQESLLTKDTLSLFSRHQVSNQPNLGDHCCPHIANDNASVLQTPPKKMNMMDIDVIGARVFCQRKSLFERAMNVLTPPHSKSLKKIIRTPTKQTEHHNAIGTGENNSMTVRRRWGNLAATAITRSSPNGVDHDIESQSMSGMKSRCIRDVTLMSPPIKSICHSGDSYRQTKENRSRNEKSIYLGSTTLHRGTEEQADESNSTGDGDFFNYPSQVVPRGIAARSNGMQTFLQALHRGIVVRRHIAGGEAEFVKLQSTNGGDTVTYRYIPHEDALIALREQRIRFNKNNKFKSDALHDNRWYLEIGNKINRHQQNQNMSCDKSDSSTNNSSLNVPNHVFAKNQSKMTSSRILATLTEYSRKIIHSGRIHAKDVIAVHPARHEDPFNDRGVKDQGLKYGTWTLRKSKSEYCKDCSFSLILPQSKIKSMLYGTGDVIQQTVNGELIQVDKSKSEKWHSGRGSKSFFRTEDFETATQGEYWVIFRGFLLLHRDAASGRFAAQRASGFSSHYNRQEDEERRHTQQQISRDGTFDESRMYASCWKWFCDLGHHQSKDDEHVRAPPSDYFLGFKSSGTQIWSRLRQAGLETQRIYALDTRRVMLKIRCPSDRLNDVAEVLKLKLKTKDGSFVPFQESLISQFPQSNENSKQNVFRSSDRQNIIDFIIRSRIRDSGAELGEHSDLGKQIEKRVPFHMHSKLESLYVAWVTFWDINNWIGRDGRSMSVNCGHFDEKYCIQNSGQSVSPDPNDFGKRTSEYEPVVSGPPSFLPRLFFGAFYQPLDTIQEYFGEEVAFYFAWLQHCSKHLVYLSVAGIILFICQICSGDWDHPLRPYFSIVVMMWGFVVLITWRKRSNFLAHRWGTLNYEEEETTRPQFKGEYKRCNITEEWIVYYPAWKRWLKYCFSLPLTVAFTVVSFIGILMVHANRDILLARYQEKKHIGNLFDLDFSLTSIGKMSPLESVNFSDKELRDPTFWLIVIGIPSILGLCYPLLNYILMKISVLLNDFENYRTETKYRNHLILKVVSFRFVCYFSSLYYYSFLLSEKSEQARENSIFRVASSLLIYLTLAHWWNLFVTIFAPLLLHRWKIHKERNNLRLEMKKIIQAEHVSSREEKLNEDNNIPISNNIQSNTAVKNRKILLEHAASNVWEEVILPPHDSFHDYIHVVVQFGYVTCFSATLTLTPLLCLFNNLLSMRMDAYKLCRGRRRPLAKKAGGIGVWEHVLHIVTVISVLTNCSLMALTSKQLIWLGETVIGDIGLVFAVVIWEHIMLLIKYIMQSAFPKMPKSVMDAKKREKYLRGERNRSTIRAKKERRSCSAVSELGITRELKKKPARSKKELHRGGPYQPKYKQSRRSNEATSGSNTSELKSFEENQNFKPIERSPRIQNGGVKKLIEQINSKKLPPRSPPRPQQMVFSSSNNLRKRTTKAKKKKKNSESDSLGCYRNSPKRDRTGLLTLQTSPQLKNSSAQDQYADQNSFSHGNCMGTHLDLQLKARQKWHFGDISDNKRIKKTFGGDMIDKPFHTNKNKFDDSSLSDDEDELSGLQLLNEIKSVQSSLYAESDMDDYEDLEVASMSTSRRYDGADGNESQGNYGENSFGIRMRQLENADVSNFVDSSRRRRMRNSNILID